jgi:hypothetical protein
MSTLDPTPLRALTLRECADELGLKSDAALKAGRLVALVLSGKADAKRRGPKLYRIERAEWERFKASVRTQGTVPVVEQGNKPRAGHPKKGSDKPTGCMSGYR